MKLYDILTEARNEKIIGYTKKIIGYLKKNPDERKNILAPLYAAYKKKKSE